MREIKFKFIENFGTEYVKTFDFTREGIMQCMKLNKDDKYGHTIEEYTFNILQNKYINVKLIQFTGLLDKNGKEIYEGDIVEIEGIIGYGQKVVFKKKVVIVNGSPKIYDDIVYKYILLEDFIFVETKNNKEYKNDVQIIGNIYETPNLLNN